MEIGTQEYYKATVLRGYFDDNDREFLVEYFVREYKKAEKENYTDYKCNGAAKPEENGQATKFRHCSAPSEIMLRT